jgi:HEPN domain-containing protein
MKPHEEAMRKVVAEWMRKADADFELSSYLLGEGSLFPSAVAFHSQQASEKYLKGFLSRRQVAFPRTHDLAELLDLVESVDRDLAATLRDVIVLTLYGVETRYPTDRPDATPEEAREAVELARKLRDAVRAALEDER